MPLTQFPLF
jgi:hypothetical protein